MRTLLTEFQLAREFDRLLVERIGHVTGMVVTTRWRDVGDFQLEISFYAGIYGASVTVPTLDLLLPIDEFSDRHIACAVQRLAGQWERNRRCLSCGAVQAAGSLPCGH